MYQIQLVVSLIILLVWGYYIFKKDISTPAIMFCLGFCICALNLLNFITLWNIHIHYNTYLIVTFGCLSLMLGSIFYDRIIKRNHISYTSKYKFIPLSTKCLLFILIFQIIAGILRIHYLNQHYGFSNLAANLIAHTRAIKFDKGTPMQFPFGVGFIINIADNIGYFIAALLPIYIQQSKKIKLQKNLLKTNFIIALCLSLLTSGRSAMLHMIIVFGSFYLITLKFFNKTLKVKQIIIWTLISYAFLSGFQQLGFIIGKDKTGEPIGYTIGVYCGAQLQNLDDYINVKYNDNKSKRIAELSLSRFYDILEKDYGLSESNIKKIDYLEFNIRKGYNLGNVSTSFQQYYLDFGIIGSFIICFIIGWFMQYLYVNAKNNSGLSTGVLNIKLYIFITLIPSMFMSFFSELFFWRLGNLFDYKYWLCYIVIFYFFYGKFPWKIRL